MNYIRNIIISAASIALASCSSEKSNQAEDDGSQKGSNTTSESGNRFYDSAVKKIQAGPPAVTAEQAKAIVDLMTKDGKIGLGEINAINLADPSKNAGYLNTALEAARKAAGE